MSLRKAPTSSVSPRSTAASPDKLRRLRRYLRARLSTTVSTSTRPAMPSPPPITPTPPISWRSSAAISPPRRPALTYSTPPAMTGACSSSTAMSSSPTTIFRASPRNRARSASVPAPTASSSRSIRVAEVMGSTRTSRCPAALSNAFRTRFSALSRPITCKSDRWRVTGRWRWAPMNSRSAPPIMVPSSPASFPGTAQPAS